MSFSEGIFGNIYYNFTVAGIIFLALMAFLNTIISKNETENTAVAKKKAKLSLSTDASIVYLRGRGEAMRKYYKK